MVASLTRNDPLLIGVGQLDDLPCFLIDFLSRDKKSFLREIK
jgi:hypothetical protein